MKVIDSFQEFALRFLPTASFCKDIKALMEKACYYGQEKETQFVI